MSAGANLVSFVAIGVLVGCGVTLLLERSLSRILLGIILIGNGVNLLIIFGGRSGRAPVAGVTEPDRMSDALPQAMVLTAIVITFGFTAFLLAISYRSWYLTGDDEVPDDLEDQQIVRRAARREVSTADLGGEPPESDPEQVDAPAPWQRRREGGPG
ncbi:MULTISPECIES: Na(+)/H(+) antiporter subunit C [unclassified Micromonospora]|uniref:Na(+)/H(+) antiporter subunit C n=1 Tax=unclassified Micromonospora TaxID=2617518 RepID=UPI0010352083|nr:MULTISPECIES: Na(+)/H(+) antiporter subunit C [unclassified Micromonospora]QKW12837.1 Na(+)/H(+) antiporter subunit C [Verrucosispora sp. NA02020]TBL35289.1 Na(+)/H(+) antiporter subunit C [Verrucosispora sp. SN26_14.1]